MGNKYINLSIKNNLPHHNTASKGIFSPRIYFLPRDIPGWLPYNNSSDDILTKSRVISHQINIKVTTLERKVASAHVQKLKGRGGRLVDQSTNVH